ncbi:ABC transporter permease subunit [Hazenella sp. IB182357]|uniref:ABC transporter permease subunit n=1 Tax=Polycladospora coralii TaxID=2771432 RepID=A0A926NGP3_9BACL|nr:ABC transporter permease subunit [Polycladospora coralii]MBD1373008.1 ABC transporter permease subunit [Polycladospora coralii]MBS7530933.1 ABC transporter permease subunit [Polycladospora coralii]
MNLYLKELKSSRKSLFFWSLGMVFMIVAGMSKYGSLATTGQSLNELMNTMPQSIQAIMGIGTLDLSTPIGYFGVVFSNLILIASIHAILMGANMIAKEETDKTAEFLLTKPLSRAQILSAKLCATVTSILLLNIITSVVSMIILSAYYSEASSLTSLMLLMTGMFFVQLIFASLGIFIATINKSVKKTSAIATAALLITYLLSIAINLSKPLENLQYLTPFKYFEAKTILVDQSLDPLFLMLTLCIVVLFTSFSYGIFKNRDLQI